ncbi:amino acid adenylation domain-containing protein [Dactylosporangium sp. NPDC000555]|uniref:amino acid adenylation domain-containing protein n=1 Tax=Dactylosporangium sp. NPDC000555 TaxID=3154260 RepID=UPI00331F6C32
MTLSPLAAVLPLTPLQEGMLFHALYDDEGVDVYHIQVAFGIDGDVDAERMSEACTTLLNRHDALRAGFQQRKSGEPVQLIRREVRAPWTEFDLREVEPARREGRLRELLAAERLRRFDMTNPPLMRFAFATLGEGRHVLALTYHHILLDGWSLPLVLRDLLTVYAAGADALADPPASFGGYLSWLAAQDCAGAERAWRDALSGLAAPTLVAPGLDAAGSAAMPRLAVRTLPATATEALTRAARGHRLTLNTVVQGAWATVLSHLAGRDDVIFGSTDAGRPPELAGVEDIVGLLMNAVPVRARLDPAEPITGLLSRLQAEQSALRAHGHLGLAEIQRLAGHGELFDTSTGFGNAPMTFDAGQAVHGLRVTALSADDDTGAEAPTGATHYALSLVAVPSECLRLELNYRPDAFADAAAERILDRLIAVLDTFVAAPDTPVGHIEQVGAAERGMLLENWAGMAVPAPEVTVPDLVERQAARTPGAPAVVLGERRMSYAELNTAANRLARVLVRHGVGPERFAAVALPRSADLIVALLAVLKTGGAYSPVDPAYPAERVSFMLGDLAPVVVLATADVPAAPGALRLDDPSFAAALAGEDGSDLTDAERTAPLTPGNAAYVIYTSGSTGRPKGVLVEHRAVAGYLDFARRAYPGLAECALVHSPASFDLTVTGIFGTLSAGGCVHLADLDGSAPPAGNALDRPAFVKATPSHLPLLDGLDPWFSPTRDLVLGGEQLTAEQLRRWRESHPGATVINEYGPTETTVGCAEYRLEPGAPARPGPIPIGRPIDTARLYVLDQHLRVVPVGTPGELYIAGAALARGYVNRPALTAERFPADPYGPPGSRMYRTGDVAWWEPDGNLMFGGRTDHQVKIRGYRIELGEIEAVLAAQPSVAQVALLAREDSPGVAQLVAYLVGAPGHRFDVERIRDWVKAALPEYMVPAAFIELPGLPLTPNGKLDRAALPAPVGVDAGTGGATSDDRTERTLAELFAQLLGVPDVGVDDSFFALGGDSIISIQLVARARTAGLVITPKDVFTQKSVRALAAVARRTEQSPAAKPDAAGPFGPTPIMGWLRERGATVDGFHQSLLLRVPAGRHAEAIEKALQEVLDRHDALRSSLRGDWSLDPAPAGAVRAAGLLHRVDVAGSGDGGLRDVIAREARAAVAGLDPAAGVMVRVVWFDAGERPGRLLVVIHHLVMDGVSWRVLLPDLLAAWRGTALDDVPTSVSSWARGLAADAVRPAREAELPYWESVLSPGEPSLTDGPLDPARDTYATAGSLTLTLPDEYTAPLIGSVPAALGADVNDVLLGALAVAVGAWRRKRGIAGDDTVLVDLEGHGRADDAGDLSRTVGWLTSLHPARLDTGGGDPADAVRRAGRHLRGTPGHGLGYGLLRYLNPRTAPVLRRYPAPQIGFNYLGRLDRRGDEVGVAPEADVLPPGVHPDTPLPHVIDLNAVTEDDAGGSRLVATWTWPSDLLTERDVRSLATAWFEALRGLVNTAVHEREPARLPLNPVQQGLLFHSLYDRDGVDPYHVQLAFDLVGELDADLLRKACRRLLRRHGALRAGFTLSASGEPIQVIGADADLPWIMRDLRPLPPHRRELELADVLETDRLERFDLSDPPLVRAALVRLTDDRYRFLLSMHHILVDGWSTSLLLRDLFQLYANPGASLPGTVPYERYLSWLSAQEDAAAEAAWRAELAGLSGPTLVGERGLADVTALPQRLELELSARGTAALTAMARSCEVTLNTVVQVAWALMLNRITRRQDLVFGATVSGRPPELDGVEEIVGLLINTQPVRIRLDPGEPIGALLGRVQLNQVALMAHHHLGLSRIQRIAGRRELFDTSIVFENYPSADALPATGGRLRLDGFAGRDAYHYALKLMAVPGERLYLEFSHRPDLVPTATARAAADYLLEILNRIGESTTEPVATLLAAQPDDVTPMLCALFADVLGHDRVDPDDDFFALGGDSLAALRVTGRVRAVLGRDLDVRAVFDHPTAGRLASVLN